MNPFSVCRALAMAVALLGPAGSANADLFSYYIANDVAPTMPSYTYFSGLANPNEGRLTFLFAHTSGSLDDYHFHKIGAYSLVNPVTPTIVNRSYFTYGSGSFYGELPSYAIPEFFGDVPGSHDPLPLLPGSSLYAGKLTSQVVPGSEYSDLKIHSSNELFGFPADSPESRLLHNHDVYGEDYTGSLAGAVIALQLVDKSAGLHVGDLSTLDILTNVGDRFTISADGSSIAFTPVFWADAGTAGEFSATFKLVDLRTGGDALGESGDFVFRLQLQAVPEPASITLVASAALVALGWRTLRARRRP